MFVLQKEKIYHLLTFYTYVAVLFTAYASHLDSEEPYIYIASDEGALYKLEIKLSDEMHWTLIQHTHPVSQSICMIGSVDIPEEGNHDVIFYAGESANSQVIAVRIKPKLSICLYSYLVGPK